MNKRVPLKGFHDQEGISRIDMRTKIKEYRTRKNLTQEKLAEIVGVRRETILFLEQGKYNPSLKLACKIARALEASIDELFILDDDD